GMERPRPPCRILVAGSACERRLQMGPSLGHIPTVVPELGQLRRQLQPSLRGRGRLAAPRQCRPQIPVLAFEAPYLRGTFRAPETARQLLRAIQKVTTVLLANSVRLSVRLQALSRILPDRLQDAVAWLPVALAEYHERLFDESREEIENI